MKHDATPRHRYELRATRRVHYMGGHFLDTKNEIFPYGKGQKYISGTAAHLAALSRADALMPLSSDVSVWQMNGYSGSGSYLKDSGELFDLGWEEVAA